MSFVGPASPPYVARQEHDTETGIVRVIVETTRAETEPPVTLALRAGEITHHLRSALDHVVHQLFVANGLGVTKKTGFPIFSSRKGYEKRAPLMIGGVPDSASAKIQAVQPFHRGEDFKKDLLWILQALNNCDKHRLIPLSIVSGGWLTILFPGRECPNLVVPIPDRFEARSELCQYPDPGVLTEPYLVPMVVFDDVDGLGNVAILPFVREALEHVDAIVASFADDFRA
jgi:hypothetical protein